MLSTELTCLSDADLCVLLQARDEDELRRCAQRLLAALEVCDFMLKMDITPASGASVCHLFGTFPVPVLRIFGANAEAGTDPVNRHFSKSILPLAWQVEQLCAPDAGQTYLLLQAKGICHGLSVMARSEHAVSRVDFYENAHGSYLQEGARLADLHLAGAYLHEAMELLWHKAAPKQVPLLSARELECLEWSATGKTSHEIGLILGISQRTVYFHLKNVATKLDVYSTRHAVSRAIMMGIIKPGR